MYVKPIKWFDICIYYHLLYIYIYIHSMFMHIDKISITTSRRNVTGNVSGLVWDSSPAQVRWMTMHPDGNQLVHSTCTYIIYFEYCSCPALYIHIIKTFQTWCLNRMYIAIYIYIIYLNISYVASHLEHPDPFAASPWRRVVWFQQQKVGKKGGQKGLWVSCRMYKYAVLSCMYTCTYIYMYIWWLVLSRGSSYVLSHLERTSPICRTCSK